MSSAAGDLAPFFHSTSVAVIGGSASPGKLGRWPLDAMKRLGFQGTVTVVNPGHEGDLLGHRCVATIAELPADVSAAIIMLPAAAAIDAARECGAAGIRHLVIGASGFGETTHGVSLQDELTSVIEKYDLRLCGPNTDGITHVPSGLALSFQPLFHAGPEPFAGAVSILSQSGASTSTIGALLVEQGIGLASTIACGNQLSVTLEDYAAYLADDPATEVVLLFIEGVRRPVELAAALDRCAANGKRVVALKVGESESAQLAVASHTGAVAGEYDRTLAFLTAHGVQCVSSLETMVAAARPLRQATAPGGERTAYLSISGGIAALMADTVRRAGSAVVPLGVAAAAELTALSDASVAMNPYDLAGRYGREHVLAVLDIFARDGFTQISFAGGILPDVIRIPLYEAVAQAATDSFATVRLFSPWLDATDRRILSAAGVETSSNLRALIESQPVDVPASPAVAPQWGPLPPLPAGTGLVDEDVAKTYLAAAGIPRPVGRRIDGAAAELSAGLAELKRPLVLKGLAPDVAHKSELGLVELGLSSDAQVAAAAAAITERMRRAGLEPQLLAEEQVGTAIEALVGFTRDPLFGPVIAVGFGGTFVELVHDIAILLPPFDRSGVASALGRTQLGRLLAGFRGVVYDLDALIDAVLLVQAVAVGQPAVESLEINPLFVRARGLGLIAGDAKLVLADIKAG